MSQAEVKKKKLRPANELIPDAQARRFFMASDAEVATARVEEMVSLLWHHTNASEQDVNVARARVIEHFNSLAPCDGAEAMLAKQMVGTHFAALECMRRAAISNQTESGRESSLKNAQKLMTLFTRQLETLNKHRGKGQQKVTVEHVHVGEGGQAIVGNVEAGPKRIGKDQQRGIEQTGNDTVPLKLPAQAKTKRRVHK